MTFQPHQVEDGTLKAARAAWWSALTSKGDPMRRPNIVDEAFAAGWAAYAKIPPRVLPQQVASGLPPRGQGDECTIDPEGIARAMQRREGGGAPPMHDWRCTCLTGTTGPHGCMVHSP